MEPFKDLVADLQPYQQYLPMLQKYFTLDVDQMKIRDEVIKLLSCTTDEQVANNMVHTRIALRRGGYTWQFNKEALKQYFDAVIADVQKQQNWTKEQWMEIAIRVSHLLVAQQEATAQERQNVARAIQVAGFAAERGADKARPTATDTKTRLHDLGEATRELSQRTKRIESQDIEKLHLILTGKRKNDYTN